MNSRERESGVLTYFSRPAYHKEIAGTAASVLSLQAS